MRRHIVTSLFLLIMSKSLLKIYRLLLLTMFVMLSDFVFSQSCNTSSKKAEKYFKASYQEFVNENYDKSLSLVNKALDKNDEYREAALLRAEIYLELKNDSLAIASYERLLEIDSMFFPRAAISLSKLYAKCFRFDDSIELLKWFLSLTNQKEIIRQSALKQLSLVEFQKYLVENPVDCNLTNLGSIVNTSADEYVNQYYVNENKLIFTKRYKSDLKDSYEENVFVTTMYDSVWVIPQPLLKEINNIGAANFSSDGNKIFFSDSNRNDGLSSCDIYFVESENGRWSEPENIKSVNTSDWESQPCVSYDGKELYFVRRNKQLGTSDIYVSLIDNDGNWSRPQRLSSNINTEGNEMAPFLHHDGKTLYFSSDGHLGMGGYDLFVSRRDDSGNWSDPVNMGYPLNTKNDELNIVISNDAKRAFVSVSSIGLSDTNYDIYEFDIDDRFSPEPVDVDILPDEDYYAIAIDRGEPVVLRNIYFEFDSFELRTDSELGIMSIVNFLNDNPFVNILLEGHTDNVGGEEYNLILSEKRAESVKNALIERGVSEKRIKAKGCGSTQPLLPNKLDDELNFLNRRVTMSIDNDIDSE